MSWFKGKKWLTGLLALTLAVSPAPWLPGAASVAEAAADNLALNKPTKTSQGASGANVVDGDPTTFWQPSMADRQDRNVWLQVDLGAGTSFNTAVIDISRVTMSKLEVLYSNDESNWEVAATLSSGIQLLNTISFPAVTARYVKIDMTLTNELASQFREFAVYNESEPSEPIPADLQRIYFADESGAEYPANAEIALLPADTRQLKLMGRVASGAEIDLSEMAKTYSSTATSVAGIDREGTATAYKVGSSRVYAEVVKPNGSKVRTPDFWLRVYNPEEFRKPEFIVNSQLLHPGMTMEIGHPAVLAPGAEWPSVEVEPTVAATVSGELLLDGQPTGNAIAAVSLAALEKRTLSLTGNAAAKGEYELRLRIEPNAQPGSSYYDSYYFTVVEPGDVPAGQSHIAYAGTDGQMVYVPDYRGNRILDFSNVGYMGGGIALPNVQAMAVVEPGEGDDTARIQQAIDLVAQLPPGTDGFRGAVLLKAGTYEIAGKLTIETSGVVLRGEGDGEDGTILLGTGKARRNLLEIGSGAGPAVNSASRQDVVDQYVPAGARSFRVADASGYSVGDTVIVRRIGNDRWIHEIGMDNIYMRPGTDGSGTSQWTPFNLDFDRVITAIDGNLVTVDAPLANSIERRWGGGQLYKYSDEGRIEQVGVENMRVVSEFDPGIIDTVMDNDTTDPYYADEDHAERFVVFNSVKNGWVRDITGYHLSYALVQLGRSSKWITVQDSKMFDMVSIITGGRRYIIYLQGQQHLVQRIYTETARHAFVYDSRVQGPNVVLDSEAQRDYNTSEPHHKWSVGGLFDNVKAPISIRDRAWLGSGHGWSGANYVNWNTEGDLTSQQPPTAQNYVIGHVGRKVGPLVPSSYDPRPRSDAYWESTGQHVTGPVSLYKQQLQDRLGAEAASHLAKTPYGGGDKDVPPQGEPEPVTNLALGRPTTTSSLVGAPEAVDGDADTSWAPLLIDREDLNVWVQVDLGSVQEVNAVRAVFDTTAPLKEQRVHVSEDGSAWTEIALKTGAFQPDNRIKFPTANARYVRLEMVQSNYLAFRLKELEVYKSAEAGQPIRDDRQRVYFVDENGVEYPHNGEIRMTVGETKQLQLRGQLSADEQLDLTLLPIAYTSTTAGATIAANGIATAVKAGANRVYAEVTRGGVKLRTPDLWIVVSDADEFRKAEFISNAKLLHDTMTMEIGQPAVIAPGDRLPEVEIEPTVAAIVAGELLRDGQPTGAVIEPSSFAALEKRTLTLTGTSAAAPADKGEYELRLSIQTDSGRTYTDSYYFTVMETGDVPAGQSGIAYADASGRMKYVPDYRGNRILDFSNVGYMSGGAALPNVQAKVVVEPGDGDDDTAAIQAAINQVSAMPLSADGFRGAVLLKKGLYKVAGTLKINASGVVLRGEGDGEDGTILLGTGKARRNLLEIGTDTAPAVQSTTKQEIVDLYVPSGARSFRVADASGYKVGDTVIVRRIGNSRWIHEIGMDYIYMRPGTDGSSTSQWTAFNLDFDRVITAIDGDRITVDAPLANAIEKKWGGGELYKYTDAGRIEQVGVENMRVDTEFDPSITNTQMDNDVTEPYMSDEDHAQRFVVFNSVKNGWVRDITAYHLSYSLVQLGRNSKWITVQDSKMYDMISVITGGTRYIIYMQGQLNFVQRVYTESARHAFVYDSRVQGPNVVLESTARNNYNTSEPHHKWSVGGLFDNVDAPISIRDRAWLGSGHGWSGANYVNWNTRDELISQQPPTAQNYVIGHVGPRTMPIVPGGYDQRPRNEAYWERDGLPVAGPVSLYKQQLQDRLGAEAVANLAKAPYGGGSKDTPPDGDDGMPLLTAITVNGESIEGFDPKTYSYTVKLPLGTVAAPVVAVTAKAGFEATVVQAESSSGTAVVTVREIADPANSLLYQIQFYAMPVNGDVPEHLTVYPIVSATATAAHASYPPTKAIDGDLSAASRWAGKGTSVNDTVYIEFDLGRERMVTHVLTARQDESNYNYGIELSADGVNWHRAYTGISSGVPFALELVSIEEASARYVRLASRGSNKDTWNNLLEIIIAGDVPNIQLRGTAYMYAEAAEPFVDPGVRAVDATDGDLSAAVTVTGSVYTNTLGEHVLSYDVTDSDGYAADTVTRTVYVRDTKAPVLTLNGASTITIDQHSAYSDPGATAADAYDGDLTGAIVISGSVDTVTVGTYTLRYEVSDSSGNAATAIERTVVVRSAGGGSSGVYTPPVVNTPAQMQDTVTVRREGDRYVVEIDAAKLKAYLAGKPVASGALLVTAPAAGSGSDEAAGGYTLLLNAESLRELITAASAGDGGSALTFASELGSYTLPLGTLDLTAIAEALDKAESDIAVELHIRQADATEVALWEEHGADDEAAAKLTVFEGIIRAGDRTYTLEQMADGPSYAAARELPLTVEQADADRTAVVRVDPVTGELHFVPAVFRKTDSGWTAEIKSSRNGLYTVVTRNESFADIGGHWAADILVKLANKRLMDGVGDGVAAPEASVTRAQLTALLVRGLGLTVDADLNASASASAGKFADVAQGAWYAEAAAIAAHYGLIDGYEDGTFRPDRPINRMELAVLLHRAIQFAQSAGAAVDGSPTGGSEAVWSDTGAIEPWAQAAINQLSTLGLIEGRGDGQFIPLGQATRAEAAVLLDRILRHLAFMD